MQPLPQSISSPLTSADDLDLNRRSLRHPTATTKLDTASVLTLDDDVSFRKPAVSSAATASDLKDPKVGVLLLNLGGPETGEDVEGFLYNLFADPDIIRLPVSSV